MIKEEATYPVSPHPHPVPQLSGKIWRVLWGKFQDRLVKKEVNCRMIHPVGSYLCLVSTQKSILILLTPAHQQTGALWRRSQGLEPTEKGLCTGRFVSFSSSLDISNKGSFVYFCINYVISFKYIHKVASNKYAL